MKEIKTIIVYFMLVLGVFATNSVSGYGKVFVGK